MKIGIFTNYGPKATLNSEGLGRYLGSLVRGFVENGEEVTIACPKWSESNLKKLLKEFTVDSSKVSFMVTAKIPPIIRIQQLFLRKKKTKKGFLNIEAIEHAIMDYLSGRDSLISFLFSVAIMGFLGGVVSIVVIGKKLIKKLLRFLKKLVKKCLIKGGISRYNNKAIRELFFEKIVSHTADEIVKIINDGEKKDVWYVPALFWPQVNDIIDQKVVICVPDLVTEEYATSFSELSTPSQTKACRSTIQGGKLFITYCDYIGRSLIDRKYGCIDKKWLTVRHSNHDMMEYISIPKNIASRLNVDKDLTVEFAKGLVSHIPNRSKFGNMDQLVNGHYIFYASQFRPHKNILNFIKAYEHLIRNRFRHERLVLTGILKTLPDIERYIYEHDLQNEIVFCNGVSAQELAALYCCADLVVNPTLYEGGFPFTFGEGMSVGTPSIMSDIPQVREVFEPAGLEEAMFNPRDYLDISEKMYWALENLDYLKQMEQPLYDKMAKRTDSVVAKEYIEVFKKLIS